VKAREERLFGDERVGGDLAQANLLDHPRMPGT
jgi:hypothetical protein